MNSSGGTERCINYVIEAIEHLRQRKARPDLDGIKNFAFRRYGIDPITCGADIDKLLEKSAIVKVEFKGRTSYRNLVKFSAEGSPASSSFSPMSSREQSPEPGKGRSAGKPLSAVCSSIIAILEDQPTAPSESGGVSIRSILSYLQSRENGRYSRKYIDQLIERETQQKNIVCVGEDSYTLSQDLLNELDQKWRQERGNSENSTRNETPSRRASSKREKSSPPTTPKPERVGQRMKRAKKVFDPSDLEGPQHQSRRRGRPVGTTKKQQLLVQPVQPLRKLSPPLPVPKKLPSFSELPKSLQITPVPVEVKVKEEKVCELCHSNAQNRKGEEENLVNCRKCGVKVHPSCMGFDNKLSKEVCESGWDCPECRPCSDCAKITDDEILHCSGCDLVAHAKCRGFSEDSVPEDRWLCDICDDKSAQHLEKPQDLLSLPAQLPISSASLGLWVFGSHQLELKGPPVENPFSVGEDDVDPSIPDASGWDVCDVHKYFKDAGLETYASILKDQDVDGTSLLLLKRDDVVRRMGLKLGPALKIYRHVRRLQTRRDSLYH